MYWQLVESVRLLLAVFAERVKGVVVVISRRIVVDSTFDPADTAYRKHGYSAHLGSPAVLSSVIARTDTVIS